MSLNLNDKASSPDVRYHISTTFTQAINDAQFVRLLGVAVSITSVVSHFLPPVNLGIACAILGFGTTSYYRGLGVVGFILSFENAILGATVMCVGIGYKGIDVLRTLSREGEGDPDWRDTARRAIAGTFFCALGLVINVVWIALTL